MRNIFDDIPFELPDELVETLAESGGTRVERIISLGHSSPDGFWYEQEQDEFVLLLKGCATLRLEDPEETFRMRRGDYLLIKANRRHRIEETTPHKETVWLTVFL